MTKLYDTYYEYLKTVDTHFVRYLYDRIPWDDPLVLILGTRGVGKTTMMLQHILLTHEEDTSLYVSADNPFLSTTSLIDLAEYFCNHGGKYLYIDEVHKYPGWAREIKTVYDIYHTRLNIKLSGSSMIDIIRGIEVDLSRRCLPFVLEPMSFREYLQLFHNIEVLVYTLDDVLNLKAKIADVNHPLPLFRDYLQKGYYPFAGDSDFEIRLRQVINQTMEVDIPQYANMNASTGRKLKKLLAVIAQSVPFKPVMDSLATVVGVSRNVLPDYFLYMEQAGMIGQLRDDTGGIRGVGKVEKVYLDNTNMAYLLGGEATDIGNIRETFFYNQLRVTSDIISSRISDFEIEGKTFEVGGKKKGKKQLSDAQDGYVVKDDIEFGSGNIIPLWAFGLLY